MSLPMKISFLLLPIFFFFAFTINANSDLNTLLKLKESLVAPRSSGLLDWTNNTENNDPFAYCTFTGVTCNNNSRVISLNITNVPLFGTIPPEIGLLDNLESLMIFGDNVTGTLPLEMSQLSSIKYVNLSYNNFSGPFPSEILLGLVNLESFDIYNNNFTGELPTEFVKLKKLENLHLGGNYFHGEIPEVYSHIESLKWLGLEGNSLTGKIPKILALLPNLEILKLGYFNSYEGGIPPEFGNISTLKLLDLGSCNLDGEIPPSLANLKKLHSLFLQMNRLTGRIPSELSGLYSLMSFDVSINQLVGEIPESFVKLQNLTLINVFRNNLHGPIPSFVGDLPNLETLQIWGNNFTLELPENLGRNGRMLFLDVTANHLTGRIPPDLCKGGRLKTLILMENYFFGPIPEQLGECKSLTRIRVRKNYLNGTIPAGFFKLPALDMLELDNNYFTGQLPTEINANNLTKLVLSNNWITGTIPPSIGSLKNLVTLSLDMNRLSGEIPEEIANLKKLLTIDLSGNNLTGEIPSSMAQCSELTLVDLSRNQLVGEVPKEITKLKSLNALNLSRNQLNGTVPGEIGGMNGLTVLDLSYNDLSGRRPTNGQLKFFSSSSFEGNPKLCSPRATFCPSASSSPQNGHKIRSGKFKTTQLVITIIILVTVALLLAVTSGLTRQSCISNSEFFSYKPCNLLPMGFRLHLKWGLSVQPPFSSNSSSWPSSHSFKGWEVLYDPARSLKPFINGDCEPSHSDPFRVRTCLSDPQLWAIDTSMQIGRGSHSNTYGDIGSHKAGISPEGEKPTYLNSTKSLHFSLLMKNLDVLENMFSDSEMSRLERDILVKIEKLGALEYFHACLSRTNHSSTSPKVLDVPRELIKEAEENALVGNGMDKIVVRSRKKQERKSRRNGASRNANDFITVQPHTKNIQEDFQQAKFHSGKRSHASRNKRQKIAKNEAEMSRGVQLMAELERIRSILEEETGRVATFSSWAEAAGLEQKELQQRLHFGWYCRDDLLKSTRSLVLYLARNYRGLGVAFGDLIQAGNMGVLQGAVRFDHTRGYKFSTYVQYWIRKSLSKLVAQHARGIRIPFTICKVINQIHKARKTLSMSHGKFPTDDEIAKFTGLSTARIAVASKCLRVVGSIDQKVGDCISANVLELTPDKSITSPEETVMRQDVVDNIYALLESLDPKEQQVIYFRFGLETHQRKSLEEIGRLYGVSKEWIRRIERRALTKLRSTDYFQHLTHYSM